MMTSAISHAIAALIRSSQSDVVSNEDQAFLKNNCLPLYRGWTATIGIRPDGTFVYFDYERQSWTSVEPEWQLAALVEGASKFPVLQALLPIRTPESEDCKSCSGTGYILNPKLKCANCCGLGWNCGVSMP